MSTPKTLNPDMFIKQFDAEPVPKTPEELTDQISVLSAGHWATPDLVAAVRTRVRQYIQARIIGSEHPYRTIREEMLEQCVYMRGDPKKRFLALGAEIRVNLRPWLEDWWAAWEETWAAHQEEMAKVDAQIAAARPKGAGAVATKDCTWKWVCVLCDVESARYWHADNRDLAEADAAEHTAEIHATQGGS